MQNSDITSASVIVMLVPVVMSITGMYVYKSIYIIYMNLIGISHFLVLSQPPWYGTKGMSCC